MPNHAIAKPISASGGTGRSVRTSGAVRSSSRRRPPETGRTLRYKLTL
ncbi:hypothetical protein BN903_60 [Halorubrum sp. AJ67]|nr:hypothetical protein BN903_60 [Halorubrum sp. AJ67]